MNVAIVIGVSKYSDSRNDLPGCKNDAKAIHEILLKTEKFQPVLYINDDQTSSVTKELITNFISDHKGKAIEELFFYYSGHGEFINDEFFYILSDFNAKKRNQTSLQNSEVDDLLRTLAPEIVIKVIDACQSGTTYIKESNALVKYFSDTEKEFKKCYFLSSSFNNQSSFQNVEISDFTLSFINSIREHTSNEIRYKDIIDYISDEFEGNPDQTPFFNIQADYTEKFCQLSAELRTFLLSLVSTKAGIAEAKITQSTLAELVKQDAKEFVNKDGAIKYVEALKSELNSFKLDAEIRELFKTEVTFFDDYLNVPKLSVIGTWIAKNENSFFAKATYEKVPGPPISGGTTLGSALQHGLASQSPLNPPPPRYQIDGFEQKIELPFKAISIDILGEYPNVSSYNCQIVFLLSKKFIRYFYFITNYIEENWDIKKVNTNDIRWMMSEFKITDVSEIGKVVNRILLNFSTRIKVDLEEKFISHDPKVQPLPKPPIVVASPKKEVVTTAKTKTKNAKTAG